MPRKHKMIDEANRVPSTFTPRFWEKHADSRSLVTRRVLARRKEYEEAVQCDSPQVESIIQRIAFLEIVLETMEVEAQESGTFDINKFTTATNTLMVCLRAIGLERKAKPVSGSLQELKERYA